MSTLYSQHMTRSFIHCAINHPGVLILEHVSVVSVLGPLHWLLLLCGSALAMSLYGWVLLVDPVPATLPRAGLSCQGFSDTSSA